MVQKQQIRDLKFDLDKTTKSLEKCRSEVSFLEIYSDDLKTEMQALRLKVPDPRRMRTTGVNT